MSDQLNYYSRYNRRKDHQSIDSLLSVLSQIRLYPFKVRNIIPDEEQYEIKDSFQKDNLIRQYEEYLKSQSEREESQLQPQDEQNNSGNQNDANMDNKNNDEDKGNDQQIVEMQQKEQGVGQQQKQKQKEKEKNINTLLQTDQVHESLLDSEEEDEHSQVIKEDGLMLSKENDKIKQQQYIRSNSFGGALSVQNQQDIFNQEIVKSNIQQVNTIMPQYVQCKSQKILRNMDEDIEIEQRQQALEQVIMDDIKQDQYSSSIIIQEEQQFKGYNEMENKEDDEDNQENEDHIEEEEENQYQQKSAQQQQKQKQQKRQKFVNNLEEVKATQSYNEHLHKLDSPSAQTQNKQKTPLRKPFKKFMLNKNKGLNPRLVTSTILNQEKPVKKVNFKKMIKKTNNLENTETKKEEKKVHFEEKKPQANKKLLMAFFQQN